MTNAVQATAGREAILTALGATGGKTAEAGDDMQNRFLTLLVTQLRNQDPLNPMDNAQMTSQLAQISTVDGIERLNQTLQRLMASAADTQVLQAATMVGHGVLVAGQGMKTLEGKGIAGVDLVEAADRVTALIKDANGLVMRTLDLGARTAGIHAFQWDGKTDAGAIAVDGAYTVELSAVRGDAKVDATALQLGVVNGVVRSGSDVTLDLGALGRVKLADVKQII